MAADNLSLVSRSTSTQATTAQWIWEMFHDGEREAQKVAADDPMGTGA
jgi:hypothetical protein